MSSHNLHLAPNINVDSDAEERELMPILYSHLPGCEYQNNIGYTR